MLMFCPKCGTQAIDGTKFCRGCGMDLAATSAVLSGDLALAESRTAARRNGDDYDKINDPDKLWSGFLTSGLTGAAFIVIALFLMITNTIGGSVWGFWLLIPGAGSLGSGIACYLKAKRIERRREQQFAFAANNFGNLPAPQTAQSTLPPRQSIYTDFYQAPTRSTGELVEPPASITEHTTRHLRQTGENETINLPGK